MTRSHKLIILVPPLLIGATFLLTLFFVGQAALAPELTAPGTTDYEVTAPVPPVPAPPTMIEPVAPSTPPLSEAPQPPPVEELVACTMDAMQCPDGSFVGRIPPTCAFAPCPGAEPVLIEDPVVN